MTFFKVALSNLKRNRVRTVLTGLSLAVSAATLTVVLALDRGYSSAVTDDLVNKTGIHLYITKEGCPIEAASAIAQGGLSPLYVEEDILARLATVADLEAILPFKLFAVTTDDGSRTDIFMGVTDAILTMKPDWRFASGGWFADEESVVIGADMAQIEFLQVGQRMYNENFDREFVVTGILERTYSQDDGTFFVPLATAQAMVQREGKLSAIGLKLADISRMDLVQNQLRAMMPADYFVLGSKELSEGILQFFGATRAIMIVMVFVAFIISVFGIINTMLMAVLERRREIAYLKCVGAGRFDLVRLITMETTAIALTGSAAGALLGMVLSPVAGNLLRTFLVAYVPSGPIARPEPMIALMAFILCSIVGLACSLYPALRAARIVPMDVLRND
jgi:putative ABC transport system permease protein